MVAKTSDGKEWDATEKLIGSVPKVRSREIHKPAQIGEFPVFVEQYGSFRMFTYNRKLVEV